tara:strand:- start:1402 stop:2289 length:888 start_codon:yes stop_codon:yes gene_type:complete
MTIGIETAVMAGVGLFSSYKSGQSAKKAAKAQNEAVARQYGYDLDLWAMNKDKLKADHAYLIESIKMKQRNEAALGEYRAKVAQQEYGYNLSIRNYQQESLEKQYAKSEQTYHRQISLNEQSAQMAAEQEGQKLFELRQSVAFEAEDLAIQAMETQGELMAKGQSGRSSMKAMQSEVIKKGRARARLAETVMSGAKNMHSALREIALDKSSANLSASSARMLKPGVLPIPPAPLPVPQAEWQLPRALEEFDFGPEPVMGAKASVSAAGGQAFWGSLAQSGFTQAAGQGAAEIFGS